MTHPNFNVDQLSKVLSLQDILSVTNETLDNIDLEYCREYTKGILNYDEWFYARSGQEHYRLLAYISTLYENSILYDVGTYYGFSALALNHNKLDGIGRNHIVSYDIIRRDLTVKDFTIEFTTEDILTTKDSFYKVTNNIPFIMLDTNHDGEFEQRFIDHLTDIKWNGLLMMDDIHHFPALNKVWNGITQEKYDITSIGHWSGTGLVVFGWK